MAEIAEEVGLPGGVLNVITADRGVSELMVRDHRVDKIAFTGSTAAGRKIGAICGERVARCTVGLGGKSAAVILDDADMNAAAMTLAGAECFLSGQVCRANGTMSSRMRWPPRSPRYRSATHSTPPRKWGRWRWSANATEWSTTSPRASRKTRRW